MIITRSDFETFLAYDATCTYDPEDAWGRVEIDKTNIVAFDKNCHSQFSLLLNGSIIQGPASIPLKMYNVSYNPNTNVITVKSYYKEYYRIANVETNSFDASYLKLREVRLDYTVPQSVLKKTFISSASIGIYGRNLACLTDYPLFDPELSALNGSSIVTGIETGSLPSARTFGLNINLSF